MSNGLISVLVAFGAGTWVFNKFQKHSGNNTKQSLIASSVVAGLILIALLSILSMIS